MTTSIILSIEGIKTLMFPSDAGVDNLSHINEEVQIITWRKSAKKSNGQETQKNWGKAPP